MFYCYQWKLEVKILYSCDRCGLSFLLFKKYILGTYQFGWSTIFSSGLCYVHFPESLLGFNLYAQEHCLDNMRLGIRINSPVYDLVLCIS